MMVALSLSSMLTNNPSLLGSTHTSCNSVYYYEPNWLKSRCSTSTSTSTSIRVQKITHSCTSIKCKSEEVEAGEEKTSTNTSTSSRKKLEIGSPVIIIEAPLYLKTAASVPCLRANSGSVKPGDVGRVMSRKPKDVWAVRLSIGTYLIDGKYFKPLDLDQ